MAASGALELIACVKMLRAGKIIPTRNLDNPAVECSGVYFPRQTQITNLKTIIKNNFALAESIALLC
jgi:3-oxoacyl-[acyl-carrier-protein] synthase II